jgi:hypothetical protein
MIYQAIVQSFNPVTKEILNFYYSCDYMYSRTMMDGVLVDNNRITSNEKDLITIPSSAGVIDYREATIIDSKAISVLPDTVIGHLSRKLILYYREF